MVRMAGGQMEVEAVWPRSHLGQLGLDRAQAEVVQTEIIVQLLLELEGGEEDAFVLVHFLVDQVVLISPWPLRSTSEATQLIEVVDAARPLLLLPGRTQAIGED